MFSNTAHKCGKGNILRMESKAQYSMIEVPSMQEIYLV